jgi:ABC-2 type transport system ATP-binding protein
MSLIVLSNLRVAYGPVIALAGVTGEVPTGAIGLLGPNGAGKTTLLKALLGFSQPSGGHLRVFDLDPTQQPLAVRQRIGYMPEVDCHLPAFSASDFVALAGELSGLPRDEAVSRSHEVLDYVGLGEARYRTLGTFSTGMKQRVKLAQALVHDPDLLLLDEPTNGLDPGGRDEMLSLLKDIAERRQMNLLLSSHVLHDVEHVCQHVLVLDQGRLVAAGNIAELVGARRAAYDVRVAGDASAFHTDLTDAGWEWQQGEDGERISLPEGQGAEQIFRLAHEAGVQVRHLRPATENLEDVFLRALARGAQG